MNKTGRVRTCAPEIRAGRRCVVIRVGRVTPLFVASLLIYRSPDPKLTLDMSENMITLCLIAYINLTLDPNLMLNLFIFLWGA